MVGTKRCLNCENPVSMSFARVYGGGGEVYACPSCETWEAINHGAATSETADGTATASVRDDSETGGGEEPLTFEDLQEQHQMISDEEGPSPYAHRDRSFEQLVLE